MKLAIFGLSVSSAWGNGHATLWRGLLGALAREGHEAIFFEKDVPYYAGHRDLERGDGWELVLYSSFDDVGPAARRALEDADVGMVTSYCPDAQRATELVVGSRARRVYYDLDTPITLAALARGERVPYLPEGGLEAFDLVLSYTGGAALDALRDGLGAKRAAPLYGSVDLGAHHRCAPRPEYACDLSYLGTYAADRQAAVQALFLDVAAKQDGRFLLGGPMYPDDMPRPPNVTWLPHVPPPEHPAFYSSSRVTLNVTRGAMAKLGWCPSGRLFEAAACGVPIVTDAWAGLETFFEPGREMLVARDAEQVMEALEMPDETLARIAKRARERTLAEHTAERRAAELVALVEAAA